MSKLIEDDYEIDGYLDDASENGIELKHYGVGHDDGAPGRGSGRYPWGSGSNPFQHSGDFLSRVQQLKDKGFSDKEIAEALGMSTTDYRTQKSAAMHIRRRELKQKAEALYAQGYTDTEIAKMLELAGESSSRNLRQSTASERTDKALTIADFLEEEIKDKGAIDVGAGVELQLGISEEKMKEALLILQDRGYNVYGYGIKSTTNKNHSMNTKAATMPDITHKDIYDDMSIVKNIGDEYHSEDGGATFRKLEYPSSIDSSRIFIRYADEGGLSKDGTIEIRQGVEDLSLGSSHYAQVRILADGDKYLKGMALYSDDIPDGYDIVFNTNKKSGTPMEKVLKGIKNDPTNPFGAAIKANGQTFYDDPNGKFVDPITGHKQSLSAVNKLKEEGDWEKSAKNLSQQFLSKQPMKLINQQLKLTYADYAEQFDAICRLDNPEVKKHFLLDFAEGCDSAAVHLKASPLPGQSTKVILPINALKDTECYAPTLANGTKVALVRYPHAGTFEIPELTVNNKNKSAKDILGNVRDAIGINSSVAERLSGADFDGDTVVVIPLIGNTSVKSTPALKGLKGFDPKNAYAAPDKIVDAYRKYEQSGMKDSDIAKKLKKEYGFSYLSEKNKQREMGVVSNLITDMTLQGAPPEDIVKAVKHSMTVIDATKHVLDYKQSERENDISQLKKRWQTHTTLEGETKEGGASTLLSRRKQDYRIPETKGSGRIDPETGQRIFKESGRTYLDEKGNEVKATKKVQLLSALPDARVLSTGTPQEEAYASYSNKMKALANKARKEYLATPTQHRDPVAAKKYETQVKELEAALNLAGMNAPKERRANAVANSIVKAMIQDNPNLSENKDDLKKAKNRAIVQARINVGADSKGSKIQITDEQWEAIQAHAVSGTTLQKILRYSNPDSLYERAMPKQQVGLSNAQISKAKAMLNSGYTYKEVADALGVSTSTIYNYVE